MWGQEWLNQMHHPETSSVPVCREGTTLEDLRREADRAVLYGTCLRALRPSVRLKPQLIDAVMALLPGVLAVFEGRMDATAQFARDYAAACGGATFLETKATEYRARRTRTADPD